MLKFFVEECKADVDVITDGKFSTLNAAEFGDDDEHKEAAVYLRSIGAK